MKGHSQANKVIPRGFTPGPGPGVLRPCSQELHLPPHNGYRWILTYAIYSDGEKSCTFFLEFFRGPPGGVIPILELVDFVKVGSIYWGKIAQGPIQMLPIWDNTLVLTKGHGIWKYFNFPMLNPHRETC